MPFPLSDQKVYSSTVAGTYTYTVPALGVYLASCIAIDVPASGISIAISQNATPIVTSPTFIQPQSIMGAAAPIYATTGDVISIVVTETTPGDPLLELMKLRFSIIVTARF